MGPARDYCAVATAALEHGCYGLDEKAITGTVEEAEKLRAGAEKAGRVLAVGHIERYNHALQEMKRRLEAGHRARWLPLGARDTRRGYLARGATGLGFGR